MTHPTPDREALRRAQTLHELRERGDEAGFMAATRNAGQQTLDAYEALRKGTSAQDVLKALEVGT